MSILSTYHRYQQSASQEKSILVIRLDYFKSILGRFEDKPHHYESISSILYIIPTLGLQRTGDEYSS